jgi:ribosomal protein L16 Arg81 hydroxylase
VGRKRWFFYPPDHKPQFNPDKSTLHWMLESYEDFKNDPLLMECILEPGDVVYFPDKWYHATLNIDKIVVFISTFLSPNLSYSSNLKKDDL